MRQLISKVARRLFPPSETIEGFEHPEFVEILFQRTKAYSPQEPWPEMAGVSSVFDFGGACGIHYKQAMRQSPGIRWAVVETPAMVARASELATDNLRFFTSIAEAAIWLGPIDVMHSDGALQYVPDPAATLKALCGLGARTMLWRRVFLSRGPERRDTQISHLVDAAGPDRAPHGIRNKLFKRERKALSEADFLAAHEGYSLSARGPDWLTFTI